MSILLGHGSQCPAHLLPSRGACGRCGVLLCEMCLPGRFCEGCQERVRFLQGRGHNAVGAPGRMMAAAGVAGLLVALLATATFGLGRRDAQANPLGPWQVLGLVILPLLSNGVLTAAGLKMARNRSYRLALTGAVVAILPVTGACWLYSVWVGIWALVVLRRPEVRAMFEEEEAGDGP